MLNKYDFKILNLEDLSLMEQINLFNRASMIISAHGAGLANISFCKKGTTILELYPQYNHENSYRIHSKVLGHNYNYLIGSSQTAIKQNIIQGNQINLMALDFEIDVNQIENFIKLKMN